MFIAFFDRVKQFRELSSLPHSLDYFEKNITPNDLFANKGCLGDKTLVIIIAITRLKEQQKV